VTQVATNGEERPNGHEQRSSETRNRLIATAIEVFAAVGYDAASTRMLTKKAKVNLSTIPYHFGGKHELYLAAAEEIADYARGQLDLISAPLEDASTGAASSRLEAALSRFLRLIVGEKEPRAWTAFLARCVHDNDEAFHIIHDNALPRFQKALVEIVAEISGGNPKDERIRLRVSALITWITSFRVLRGLTLRSVGSDRFSAKRIEQLDVMIREFARSDFLIGSEVPRKLRR